MQNGTDDKGTDRGIYKKKSPYYKNKVKENIPYFLILKPSIFKLNLVLYRRIPQLYDKRCLFWVWTKS